MNGILRQAPNILTGLRLFAAPMLAFLLLQLRYEAALGVFAFAAASDAVDGFLAKRFGLATRFGRYLDPAADKLLMLAAFIALTMLGIVPWWLTFIVIGRDVAIVLGVLTANIFVLPLKIEPLAVGKLSTAVQVGYVTLLLIFLAANLHWPQTALMATFVAGAVTLFSWAAYAQLWLRALAQSLRRTA